MAKVAMIEHNGIRYRQEDASRLDIKAERESEDKAERESNHQDKAAKPATGGGSRAGRTKRGASTSTS